MLLAVFKVKESRGSGKESAALCRMSRDRTERCGGCQCSRCPNRYGWEEPSKSWEDRGGLWRGQTEVVPPPSPRVKASLLLIMDPGRK